MWSDLQVSSDNLPDDPETLKAMLLAERHESERLRH
jgi:transposase